MTPAIDSLDVRPLFAGCPHPSEPRSFDAVLPTVPQWLADASALNEAIRQTLAAPVPEARPGSVETSVLR